jgi:hypothetical protein
MATKTAEVTIPSIVAAVFLILTALDEAEVTMAAAVAMLLGLLVFHSRLGPGSLWPKLAAAMCAAAIAIAAVLLMR